MAHHGPVGLGFGGSLGDGFRLLGDLVCCGSIDRFACLLLDWSFLGLNLLLDDGLGYDVLLDRFILCCLFGIVRIRGLGLVDDGLGLLLDDRFLGDGLRDCLLFVGCVVSHVLDRLVHL